MYFGASYWTQHAFEGITGELGHVLYMDEDVATIMNQHTCDILFLYDVMIYKVCYYSMFHKRSKYYAVTKYVLVISISIVNRNIL